jgi:Protein of unknown function (DUF2971)
VNLYHYTTQAGLLGILRTKSLWVSSIRHLNDSAELTYAMKLMKKQLARKPTGDASFRYYQKVLESIDAIEPFDLYVGSFSEKRDLLSQWRAYTHGGVGFSVGFDRDRLKKLASMQDFRLVQCVYTPERQASKIEAIVSKFADYKNDRITNCVHGLLLAASKLKHPSFREEREWRVVSKLSSEGSILFRVGKSMLIAYRKFNLVDTKSQIPITRIVVGPNPHMELAVQSVKSLLDSQGILDVEVISSSVPYRHW